jgi:hypothetical protein
VDCAAFAVTPVTTHGDLNANNFIGPVPMLVDWEYAQLADPIYDLACLSVYYPGLRLRRGELLGTAGITDANGRRAAAVTCAAVRLPQQALGTGGSVATGVAPTLTPRGNTTFAGIRSAP